MSGPLRGGGGVKGRAIKEKIKFFGTFFGPAIKNFFLRLPLYSLYKYVCIFVDGFSEVLSLFEKDLIRMSFRKYQEHQSYPIVGHI